MIRILNFLVVLVIVQSLAMGNSVFAEVVAFRETVDKQRCFSATLNETIAVKVNGQTGPSCNFSVDVGAGGEWVNTGGYFDSPPYAWGTSVFYPLNVMKDEQRDFSFTCSQPVYELDKSTLPSYINVAKEEDIPASGSGTPVGKKYFFEASASAQAGTSFNLPLKYTTNCNMKMKTASQSGEFAVDSIQGTGSKGDNCGSKVPIININPRTKTSAFPLTLGTACGATPSASPSESPSGSPSASPSPSPSPTPPPACNVSCTSDVYCQAAQDGCTSCVPNDTGTGSVCKPPPACNTACTSDRQCAGVKDGCVSCINGVCKKPPSCGTACVTKAECSGVKDNCNQCLEGTCTDYNDNMCKCDGLVADMVYPSDSFNFEAFGKVEGANVKKAQIADVTFRLTRDNQVIAKSNPITPTIVESSANKLRVKAAWSTPPPPVTKGATYRVFADVRCKPKRIIASNENFSPVPQAAVQPSELKPPLGLKMLVDGINKIAGDGNSQVKSFTSKLLSMFGGSEVKAQSPLQLQTLNFVKVMDTDNCRFVMFKFDETLF